MMSTFLRLPKTDKVKNSLINEFNNPDPEFHPPFNDSLPSFIRTLTETVDEDFYLLAVQNRG